MTLRGIAFALALAAVAAALVLGFRATGSPADRRGLALDADRVANIVEADRMHSKGANSAPDARPTGLDFRTVSPTEHEWCATFDEDTRSFPGHDSSDDPPDGGYGAEWRHPAGPYCFVFADSARSDGGYDDEPVRGEVPRRR